MGIKTMADKLFNEFKKPENQKRFNRLLEDMRREEVKDYMKPVLETKLPTPGCNVAARLSKSQLLAQCMLIDTGRLMPSLGTHRWWGYDGN